MNNNFILLIRDSGKFPSLSAELKDAEYWKEELNNKIPSVLSLYSKIASGNWLRHEFVIFSYRDYENEGIKGWISLEYSGDSKVTIRFS